MSGIVNKMGVTDFVLERTCPEELLNLNKSGFVSEEGHSGCKPQNIAIRALKGNVLCQIWFKWTCQANLANWWGSSKNKFAFSDHSFLRVATARWQGNYEISLTSHIDFLFIFGQCGDKSVSEKKHRDHWASKIVKSKQSYSNGHLPYHCSF